MRSPAAYTSRCCQQHSLPLAPESDEEKPPEPQATGAGRAGGEYTPKPVHIDLDKLQQRIVALPLPARGYTGIAAGKGGVLYVMERAAGGGRGGSTLSRFDLKTRKTGQAGGHVTTFDLSAKAKRCCSAWPHRVADAG